MSKQGGNTDENKESLYNQEGVLQLEFAVASTVTPANITNPKQFVPPTDVDTVDDLSEVPLYLLRGYKHEVVKRLSEKRGERSRELLQFLLQNAVEQTLKTISEQIECWQEQMGLILIELAEQQEDLDRLLGQNKALKDTILTFQETGLIDRNDEGELQNADAHIAVENYIQENALPLYRTASDAELYVLLLDTRADIERQSLIIDGRVGELTEEYEQYKVNTEHLITIREDLESTDFNRQQAGLMAYSELEKRLQLEVDQQLMSPDEEVAEIHNRELDKNISMDSTLVVDILDGVEPFSDEVSTQPSNTISPPKR